MDWARALVRHLKSEAELQTLDMDPANDSSLKNIYFQNIIKIFNHASRSYGYFNQIKMEYLWPWSSTGSSARLLESRHI